MIKFDHFLDFRRILGKKRKIYIKLTIIPGKKSKLKKKTEGFGKIKNAVCRKSVEKKAAPKSLSIKKVHQRNVHLIHLSVFLKFLAARWQH